MFIRAIMIAMAIAGVQALGIVAWDVTVAANQWQTTSGGNITCNKSILASECRMLDDKDLEGMYRGLTKIKDD